MQVLFPEEASLLQHWLSHPLFPVLYTLLRKIVA